MVRADGRPAMLVLPAVHQVDLSRAATALGAQDVRLAQEDEFAALFPDCDVGAMPPFGERYGVPVYVDPSLAEAERIVCPPAPTPIPCRSVTQTSSESRGQRAQTSGRSTDSAARAEARFLSSGFCYFRRRRFRSLRSQFMNDLLRRRPRLRVAGERSLARRGHAPFALTATPTRGPDADAPRCSRRRTPEARGGDAARPARSGGPDARGAWLRRPHQLPSVGPAAGSARAGVIV